MEKYIYISIPKTGTNSVHEIMGQTKYNHITANTIKTVIGENEYNSKESFCFIRNPVDLVKSWYYYHKYNPRVPKDEGALYYPDTIDKWVFDMNCKTHWEENKHTQNNKLWDVGMSPLHQCNWIKDVNDNIIVNEIYRFDDLNKVLEYKFSKKVKTSNKSNKDLFELSTEVENAIKNNFHEDIELYEKICPFIPNLE